MINNDKKELEPCPFCFEEVNMAVVEFGKDSFMGKTICSCGSVFYGIRCKTKEEAITQLIKLFNTRYKPEPIFAGWEVSEIKAMWTELKKGNYSPNDTDWDAYKAGYEACIKDVNKELNAFIEETAANIIKTDTDN